MEKRNHGDRSAEPLPIEELVARHEVEIEQGALPFDKPDPVVDWQSAPPTYAGPTESMLEEGQRMQAAAIAGGSFGSTGCFDDEILLTRANAIFTYIKNGLQ